MKLRHTLLIAFGSLLLCSCSETAHDSGDDQVAHSAPSSMQQSTPTSSESDPSDGVHARHANADGHSGNSHNTGDGDSDDGHSNASGHHDGQHQSSARSDRPHRSHGHQHSAQKHSREGRGADRNTKKIAIGERVPDFDVTINGKTWKLSELQKNAAITKDGTLVLTFWCSFCHSCRHVEHRLDKLAQQYKGKAGVIALDASAGETAEEVAAFSKERGLTLPIALDSSGVTADIFGTRVTTTTVVIDSQGVLRYRGQFGDNRHAFAEDALNAVLAGDDIRVKETRHRG